MKKKEVLLFFALIYFAYVNAQERKSLLTDNPMKTHIDTVVNNAALAYKQDLNTNGVSIGIAFKGNKYTYNYGAMVRGSQTLPTADTYYNLGSVAKTFITTMLAEAVIEKKVKLTDDIRIFLPNPYPNLEYKGNPIRLVDLANHTSSLPKEFRSFAPSVMDSVGKLDIEGQISYFSKYNQDSLLLDLKSIRPDTIPGTKYQYNGNAMMLLMYLTERIYKMPYNQIVTTYLSKNFGMYDTKMILTDQELKHFAPGYNDENQPQRYVNYTGYTGGPSMNSTLDDMVKFLEANVNEENKAIALTHRPTWGKPDGFAIGLGWMMNTVSNGQRFIYHDGHTGIGFNTHCIFYPQNKLGIVIIVNDVIDQERVRDLERSITIKLLVNKDEIPKKQEE